MFRTQELVPEVYPDKSRDFQLFCRMYDVVFNSVKRSIDSMNHTSSTDSCDARLLPLLKTKLGFFSDLEVTDDELRKILAAFPHIVKYKGSSKAIQYIINLYSRLFASSEGSVNMHPVNSNYVIEVFSDTAIQKTEILVELLKYIVPTGYMIDYYRTTIVNMNTCLQGTSIIKHYPKYVSKIVIRDDLDESLSGMINIAEVPDSGV